jgi:hypothetical protein
MCNFLKALWLSNESYCGQSSSIQKLYPLSQALCEKITLKFLDLLPKNETKVFPKDF